MRHALRYGDSRIHFDLPPSAHLLTHREPERDLDPSRFRTQLHTLLPDRAVRGPIAVVLADKTRLCGYPLALPWLLETLLEWGAEREQITCYIAYGTHPPQSEAESSAAYGPAFTTYRFIHHSCTDKGAFVDLGTTSRGTPVRLRRDVLEAELIITFGAVSHHYFAGFGGGRKLLFPGLGEQEAIYANHRLFLDMARQQLAPGCRPGNLVGNPLAEDLEEVETMLPPYLSIHGLLDSHGQVAGFRFGSGSADFLAACREHDALYRAASGDRYDLVLASAGGYPKDINFIQSHKAVHNAAAFVADGGTLVLLAECRDGVGSTTFLPYFETGGWHRAFTLLSQRYAGNGGTALAMMAKTARITISMVTALAPSTCSRIGVRPVTSEQAAQVLASHGKRVAVIDNASLLVHPGPA